MPSLSDLFQPKVGWEQKEVKTVIDTIVIEMSARDAECLKAILYQALVHSDVMRMDSDTNDSLRRIHDALEKAMKA